MAEEKKKKKVDKIKRSIEGMQKSLVVALEEYEKFKGGTMIASTRARAALMEVQKSAKGIRQLIQEKKNSKMEKK